MLSAQALIYNLKQLNGLNRRGIQAVVDNLQTAALLALFVSDHFGGSDRGAIVERTRKSVSGSNYNKPFVCTCSTGSSTDISVSAKSVVNSIENITLSNICEKSLNSIKDTMPDYNLQFVDVYTPLLNIIQNPASSGH